MGKLFQLLFSVPTFTPNPLIDESGELTPAEKRILKLADTTQQQCNWGSRWLLIMRGLMLAVAVGWLMSTPVGQSLMAKIGEAAKVFGL